MNTVSVNISCSSDISSSHVIHESGNSRINFIYEAIQNGWTVRKVGTPENSYELSYDIDLLTKKSRNRSRSISTPVSKNELLNLFSKTS